MTPKKRKSTESTITEEKPEITLDLEEETEAKEKTKEDTKEEETEEKTQETGEEEEKTEEEKKKKPSIGEKIKQNIDQVKAQEGVIGYILRNSRSASIDLKDPTKIIDFAVLSSSALQIGKELSSTFELGDVKYILVEGKTIKLLSFTLDENRVGVFMEKTVDHNNIYKTLTR